MLFMYIDSVGWYISLLSYPLHSLSAQVCSRHGTHVLTRPILLLAASCRGVTPPPTPCSSRLLSGEEGHLVHSTKKNDHILPLIALLFHRSSSVFAIKALAPLFLFMTRLLSMQSPLFCFYLYSNLVLTARAPPTGHWASTAC